MKFKPTTIQVDRNYLELYDTPSIQDSPFFYQLGYLYRKIKIKIKTEQKPSGITTYQKKDKK